MEPKHYVCAVIWRRNQAVAGGKELVVMNVTSTYRVPNCPEPKVTPVQTKFPGGMQRLPEDSVEVTLTRELVEETNLRYSGPLNEICKIPVRDRDNQSVIDHHKHGILVPFEECTGVLRTDPLQDDNDYMSRPRWEPIDEVGRALYKTQQPILIAAIDALRFM
jgi:hypothetical protein